MRQRKCKAPDCDNEYTPGKIGQKACSVPCAIIVGRLEEDKRKRRETREAKARLKTKSQHIKETQVIVNRYVRLRDKGLPCCACGNYITGVTHASHYRPAGSHSRHRFDADRNIWASCYSCNAAKSGNLTEYRKTLIDRIGIDAVEGLENDNRPYKWTVEELKQIQKIYKAKIKELENEMQSERV